MKQHIKQLAQWRLTWLLVGLLLGAGSLLTIRFVTYNPEHTHYHANFALYINGQRELFKSSQYYQDVAICSADTGITIPQQRAHLHDNINDAVHIHDHAVTWGQFFNNLGWTVTGDLIETADGTKYVTDDTHKLHIIINNQDFTDLTPITNTVIKDRDRLLVSFGDVSDSQLASEFKQVASSAKHYDESKDPASCAANDAPTTKQRLEHLL